MDDYDIEVVRPDKYGTGASYEGIAFATKDIAQKEDPVKNFRVKDVEVPYGEIQVKTEIRWSWKEKLNYDSRLYWFKTTDDDDIWK